MGTLILLLQQSPQMIQLNRTQVWKKKESQVSFQKCRSIWSLLVHPLDPSASVLSHTLSIDGTPRKFFRTSLKCREPGRRLLKVWNKRRILRRGHEMGDRQENKMKVSDEIFMLILFRKVAVLAEAITTDQVIALKWPTGFLLTSINNQRDQSSLIVKQNMTYCVKSLALLLFSLYLQDSMFRIVLVLTGTYSHSRVILHPCASSTVDL